MDDLLGERIFKAYRRSLLEPPVSRLYAPPNFDYILKQVLSSKIPANRRIGIRRIWRTSFAGLQLARQGKLQEALEAFLRCRTDLEGNRNNPLPSLDRALAQAPLDAAHAYLDYKLGDFDQARRRVLDSMDADLLAEDDDDLLLLEMHRLQLAQNLMRIDLRSGESTRALRLAGQILAYVEGFIDQLPVHHSWKGRAFIAKVSPSIRSILIPQMANDIALSLSRLSFDDAEKGLLQNVRIESYRCSPKVLNERFRLWLIAKEALHQNNWDLYLTRLSSFLKGGRHGIQPIWYSSMIDLLKACQAIDNPASRRLQERILHDVPKWPGVPTALRPALGLGSEGDARAFAPQVASYGAVAFA